MDAIDRCMATLFVIALVCYVLIEWVNIEDDMGKIRDAANYANALSGKPVLSECHCCDESVVFIWPKLKGLPMPRAEITLLCPDCFWQEDCHDRADTVYVKASFAEVDDTSRLVDGHEEFNE